MTRAERIHQRLDSAGMGYVSLGAPLADNHRYPRLQYSYTPDSRRRRWVMALGAGLGERVWTTSEIEAALDLLEAWRNQQITPRIDWAPTTTGRDNGT